VESGKWTRETPAAEGRVKVLLRNSGIGIYALIGALACTSGKSPGREGQTEASVFRDMVVARNTAAAMSDTAALRPMLDDSMVWVIGATSDAVGKTQLLAAAGTPQDPRPRFDVDSLRVREIGEVALVDYRRTDRRRVGTYEDSVSWHVFEAFRRNGARWLLLRHDQSWIRRPLTALNVDSASLARFVGHYEIDASYIDYVHFEGRELVATPVGFKEGGHLIPVSQAAFIPDGVAPLLVFERDAKGKVLDYVQGYPDGRVIRARRLD
jgi:hypothetical protein